MLGDVVAVNVVELPPAENVPTLPERLVLPTVLLGGI
jgi:hypothetical protein